MKKIKNLIKIVAIVGIVISGFNATSISAATSEEETKEIQPRVTLTAYGDTRSMGGGVKITPFIQYDSTTGRIQNYNVRATNLAGKTYRYDATYTNNRTAVNFTVTIYSTNIFGGLDRALETQYWTVKSPGLRSIEQFEFRYSDTYQKQ